MECKCPYCGNVIKRGLFCDVCLERIEPFKKIWDKSAFYYNKGLEAAKRKDLSLACTFLQKAITLYRYNIDARNLLGLIYFEIGQLGDALKEWIMSQFLQRENNLATLYIERVHNEPKYLANNREAINLYNKSLSYLKQKGIDMAMIRLKKAVAMQPNFIEARALLALVYIEQKQYYKANEQVKKVLAIDEGHKRALMYSKILSGENTETIQPYDIEYKPEVPRESNIHKMLDRRVIHRRAVLYFALGVLSVVVIGKYLILPNEVNDYKLEAKRLVDERDELSRKLMATTNDYETKLKALEDEKSKFENEIEDYKTQVTEISQKEKLSSAKNLLSEREYIEAAKAIYSIAVSNLEQEDLETYNQLKEEVYPRAVDVLYNEGITAYNRGEYTQAITPFENLLIYEPKERSARKSLYYLARSYEKIENIDMAKKYYDQVIATYPDTTEYYNAQSHLENISGT